jgi:hypothetical protein
MCLLCLDEIQYRHTRWSQVLQNRHVIFVWRSSHLILSRITFCSTSWNGMLMSIPSQLRWRGDKKDQILKYWFYSNHINHIKHDNTPITRK